MLAAHNDSARKRIDRQGRLMNIKKNHIMKDKPLVNFALGRAALLAALSAGCLAFPSSATAQSQSYWDATSPIMASPGSGGAGNWSTGTADWWVSGSSDSDWANGNIANFAGTAGTA